MYFQSEIIIIFLSFKGDTGIKHHFGHVVIYRAKIETCTLITSFKIAKLGTKQYHVHIPLSALFSVKQQQKKKQLGVYLVC